MRRVVVTGMGIVSSIGNDAATVLTSLRNAKSGISSAPDYKALDFRSQVHGDPNLDPKDMIDRRAMRFHGRGTAWNHIAMDQAILDSGLEPGEVSHERTGLIMGSGGTSFVDIVNSVNTARTKGPKKVGPFLVPKAMTSTASATLSTWFKIRGRSRSMSSACSTSSDCIGDAFEDIQAGRLDIAFAGGCEDLGVEISVMFDAMGALSSRFNDRPAMASRAYDVDRDGFVIAGGAGVLVLELLEHAKARGAKIYGEVAGYASTCDGFDMVQPSGEGAVRCMKMAMGALEPQDINYINTHGTSTPIGDLREVEAIRKVFGSNTPWFSSTKSLTGHSLGATGVQEAIYCLLMINHGFIANSANIENLDPMFKDEPVVRNRIDKQLDTVLSNSFGFGGANACLVLKRYNG